MDLNNIFNAAIAVTIGYLLSKYLIKYLRHALHSKTAKETFKKLGYNEAVIDYAIHYLKLFIYVVTFIAAVSALGFAQEILTLIVAVLIISVIGILVYSLRDLIPNAFAGYYIKTNRIIREGEKIKIKDFEGKVKKVDLLTIAIEDEKGELIIIPNNLITKHIIKKK